MPRRLCCQRSRKRQPRNQNFVPRLVNGYAPFTGNSTSEPLRDVLAKICAASQWDYILRDGEIVVTTTEAAAESRSGLTALRKKLPKLKNVSVQW